METTFTKTFLTNLLGKALFKKDYLKKNDYSFNNDFVREHKEFLSGKTDANQWLNLEIVCALYDMDKGGYLNFKNLIIEDLHLFRKVLQTHTEVVDTSEENLKQIIDYMLDQCIENEVIDGLLILFLQEKVVYLDEITKLDIEKGSLPKDEFELLVDYYL